MRQSAGRAGNCWDNSVVESFFSSLKPELVSQTRFATSDHARREIFTWIGRCNTHIIHSTLDYLTPTEWENHHRQPLEQAA
jgi:transposase InsO family protein